MLSACTVLCAKHAYTCMSKMDMHIIIQIWQDGATWKVKMPIVFGVGEVIAMVTVNFVEIDCLLSELSPAVFLESSSNLP